MKHLRQDSLILVVDSDSKTVDEVATVLAKADFSCRCCTTVEEAVAAAESCSPELIVSGASLQGQSGLEACERIRREGSLRDVPVMFLCGGQVPDIIRRNDALGSTYYLRKPFDPDVLVELIDTALGGPRPVAAGAKRPSGAFDPPPGPVSLAAD